MVARQYGDVIVDIGPPAAETGIPPLRRIENMLIIHKRLKIKGTLCLLETNRKPSSPNTDGDDIFGVRCPSGRFRHSAISAIMPYGKNMPIINKRLKIKGTSRVNQAGLFSDVGLYQLNTMF